MFLFNLRRDRTLFINCATQAALEIKCGKCEEIGHSGENCFKGLEWASYASVDGIAGLVRAIHEASIWTEGDERLKDRKLKKKLETIARWVGWPKWIVEHAVPTFWLTASTMVASNPELAGYIQEVYRVLIYVQERLRGEAETLDKALQDTKPGQMKTAERKRLQNIFAPFYKMGNLWQEICAKMRPCQERKRVWGEVTSAGESAEKWAAINFSRIQEFASVADHTDSNMQMAPFANIWLLGKIFGLIEAERCWATAQTKLSPVTLKKLSEMVTLLEYAGVDEKAACGGLQLFIGDAEEMKQTMNVGLSAIHELVGELLKRASNEATATAISIEGLGCVWGWISFLAGTPFKTDRRVEDALAATYLDISKLAMSWRDVWARGIEKQREEDSAYQRFGEAIAATNEKLKATAEYCALHRKGEELELGKKLQEHEQRLKPIILGRSPQIPQPNDEGSALKRARQCVPAVMVWKAKTTTFTITRGSSTLAAFSEIIEADRQTHRQQHFGKNQKCGGCATRMEDRR